MESFEIGVDIPAEEAQQLLYKRVELFSQIHPELEFCGIYSNSFPGSTGNCLRNPHPNSNATEYFLQVDADSKHFNWFIKRNEFFEAIPCEEIRYYTTETDKICISQCLLLSTGKSNIGKFEMRSWF